MVIAALILCSVSAVLFVAVALTVRAERRRERRLFAARIRGWLDVRIESAEVLLGIRWQHFIKYILQLHWYYSIHSVLRTILRFTVAVYTYFENAFERNRTRAKELRAEKRQLNELNHLRQMAVHKENTALTPGEQRRLRTKKLEERY